MTTKVDRQRSRKKLQTTIDIHDCRRLVGEDIAKSIGYIVSYKLCVYCKRRYLLN